jgi:hypothetical protein
MKTFELITSDKSIHDSEEGIRTALFDLCYKARGTLTSVYAFSETMAKRAAEDIVEIDHIFSVCGGTDSDWDRCQWRSDAESKRKCK